MNHWVESFVGYNVIYLTTVPTMVVVFLISFFLMNIRVWYIYDFLLCLSPGIVYWGTEILKTNLKWKCFSDKTMANFSELLFVGIIVNIIFLIRIYVAKYHSDKIIKFLITANMIVFVLVVLLELFFPALPE